MPNNERITPVAPDVRPMPETATIDGQPAWLASDVGMALGYQEPERVRWTAEAGREGFDPAAHVVYAEGEAYLTAEGVRHACSRRKRSKGLAARLLEHIETATAPKREWSTAAFPGEATSFRPWPTWAYDPLHEALKAERLGAERKRRYGVASILFGYAGVAFLCAGLAEAQASMTSGGVCLAIAALFLFTSGLEWGSR